MSIKDLSEDNLINIALFSGEMALIEVASWTVPPKYRNIVRMVACGPNVTTRIDNVSDFEHLPSYGISLEHWMQFRKSGINKYVRLLAKGEEWCPKVIESLFGAGIISAPRFFASKRVLRNLCMVFPNFVDYYCDYMTKHHNIKSATLECFNRRNEGLFVTDSRLIHILSDEQARPSLIYALDDPTCLQKWQADLDANPNNINLNSAYRNSIFSSLYYGRFDILLKNHVVVDDRTRGMTCWKKIKLSDDAETLQNVINKFDSKIVFEFGSKDILNKIKHFYNLKKAVERVELSDYYMKDIINNKHVEALELLNELNIVEPFDIIRAICDESAGYKFNTVAVRILQSKHSGEYLLKDYMNNFIKDCQYCVHIINWLYKICPKSLWAKLMNIYDDNRLIVRSHKIVKFMRRKNPELCFNFGNYDIDDLKKYELISKDEYILERLKRCSAAEFEAYFDKWSIKGHETHIRNVLKKSMIAWICGGEITKINLICNTPKFADIIDRDSWEKMLRYVHCYDHCKPLPIDLICLIITKLANHNINQTSNEDVNINLLYAIYKVFKCGYGDDLMREKLLNFINNVDSGTIIANFNDDQICNIAAMAMGLIARNHKYEDYEAIISTNPNNLYYIFQFNLAAIVAGARMPKDISYYTTEHKKITNFFISLIDPQFDNLY